VKGEGGRRENASEKNERENEESERFAEGPE
jgi:hypothetical protein